MSDLWEHKMNDTMYNGKYLLEREARLKLLLRCDGYSMQEIDNDHRDENGQIKIPDNNIRDEKRRSTKKNIPTENELKQLEEAIDKSPIILKLDNH